MRYHHRHHHDLVLRRGRRSAAVALALTAAAAIGVVSVASPAVAVSGGSSPTLRHVGTFFVTENLAADDPADTSTSAEIVDLSVDGRTLVYTDGLAARLGFADVSDPANPAPLGTLDLGGSPTSVAVHRQWALAAISTSDDFDAPSGELVVVEMASRQIVHRVPLAGQPDSVAVSPSGRYAAIVIENERDEDENDGLLPQLPAGTLQVLSLAGVPERWALRPVDLTGLADVAPEDPEPEYVDINGRDQAVVSLQENNHLVLVNLRTASVLSDFSAGSTDIDDVDTVEEELGPQGNGIIDLSGSLVDRRREPDTVAWVDNDTFATANEGDYDDENGVEGGTRSFTLFNVDGRVEFEAGSSFEHEVVRVGHYPEGRSENKGSEPEGLEVGRYRGRTLLFVGAERANLVAVYDVTTGTPRFVQVLPTGIGPEGIKFTSDGLLAVTAEVDGAEDGFSARPFITLFAPGAPGYPQLRGADDESGLPIPWVAMSGLAGDPDDAEEMWAVSDSFLAQAYLYRLDVSATPAVITERAPVGGVEVDDLEGDFDLEGVAARPEGGFWLASEGRIDAGSSRPNLLVRTDDEGAVVESVPLPASLVTQATSNGLEGVAVTGSEASGDEVVWTVIQREWGDDPDGLVKVGRYEVASGTWTFAHYPLDPVESPAGGWVGLSEVTALPDGRLAVVERDNQLGQEARVKRIYAIEPTAATVTPHGTPLPVLAKVLLRDVLSELDAASISVPDKIEGLGVTANRRAFIVTDNDGVDENYGETVFVPLGATEAALGGG